MIHHFNWLDTWLNLTLILWIEEALDGNTHEFVSDVRLLRDLDIKINAIIYLRCTA